MKRFPTDVITLIKGKNNTEGKNTFALGSYGIEFPVSNIGLRIKKTLQEDGLSVRLVNTENKNIVSAVFKRERLAKSQTEYNLLVLTPTSEKDAVAKPIARDVTIFLAVTLACQDIDAYTRRDTGKSRDMVVGMMPPKLVQMMLNIATQQSNQESVISDQNGTKKNNTLLSDNCKLQTANSTALRAVYDPFC